MKSQVRLATSFAGENVTLVPHRFGEKLLRLQDISPHELALQGERRTPQRLLLKDRMRSRWFVVVVIRGRRLAVVLIFCRNQMMVKIAFLCLCRITPSPILCFCSKTRQPDRPGFQS